MTYDVPFLRHVTSNKTYNCCIFSNFVNSEPIDLKIGTHTDLTCTIYHIKNRTNKNNITRISMANKYHILKHRAFFKRYVLYGIRGRGRTMRETETVGTVHSQNYRHCTKGGS